MNTFCTTCGTRREGNETFCTHCAARFDDQPAQGPDEPVQVAIERTGYGSAWFIGLSAVIAVVVIGAVVGGVVLFQQRQSSASPDPGTTSLVPPTYDGPTYTEPSYTEPAYTEPTYTESTEPTYAETTPTYSEPTETLTTEVPTPTPTLGNSTVGITPEAASHPSARAVVALLTSYFDSINDRNYTTYRKLHSKGVRADLSEKEFVKGYKTTNDSEILISGLGPGPDGRLLASVDFVSHQAAADGPEDGETCTRWSVSKFLEKEGTAYRIGKSLKGYSNHTAC